VPTGQTAYLLPATVTVRHAAGDVGATVGVGVGSADLAPARLATAATMMTSSVTPTTNARVPRRQPRRMVLKNEFVQMQPVPAGDVRRR
jgi:hypothetical protein